MANIQNITKHILLLSMILLSITTYYNSNKYNYKFFNPSGIETIVELNGERYYRYKFNDDGFKNLDKNPTTYKKFVVEALRDVFNVNINTDTIICYVYNSKYVKETDKFSFKKYILNYNKFKKEYSSVKKSILIPVKKDIKFRRDYNTTISDNIDDIVMVEKNSYIREIDSLNGSDKEVYTEFIKNKAMSFYNRHDKIEDVILHTCLYIHSVMTYDMEMKYTQDNIKEILDNKRGVCSGFTAMFSTMMDTVSIVDERINKLATMTYYSDGLGHVRNIMNINNENYIIDVTWMVVQYRQGVFESTNLYKENYFMYHELTDITKDNIVGLNIIYSDTMSKKEFHNYTSLTKIEKLFPNLLK